jgi:hypothetical protein
MIPWFGFGQVIEGLFREDQLEITEVEGDMSLIICQFGVSFEGFSELLENHRGCPDMFRFWKESGGPNLITFLELFLWGALRIWLEFIVLVIHILYKGQKQASATGINSLGVLLLSLPLVPPFHLTTYTILILFIPPLIPTGILEFCWNLLGILGILPECIRNDWIPAGIHSEFMSFRYIFVIFTYFYIYSSYLDFHTTLTWYNK